MHGTYLLAHMHNSRIFLFLYKIPIPSPLKNNLKQLIFKSPTRYLFWILLAFLFKGVIPLMQLFLAHRSNSDLLSLGFVGDSPSYTDPVENFLTTGHYSPDRRLPGFGIIYLIFRLLFSYTTTYDTIVIIQLVVSSVSVYCLALLARLVLKSDRPFYLTFYMFLTSNYSNYYDICLMTESLSSSFLIFGTWYFALYFQAGKSKLKYLLFSGIFLTWTFFLRPVFVLVLPIYGIILLLYSFKNKVRFIRPMFIYALAFIVIDGAWIIRNYKVHNKFIPLSNNFYYPYVEGSYMGHMQSFVQTWGGAIDLPDPHSAFSWFGGILFPGEPDASTYKHDSIPGYVYTSAFNKDSLYKLRKEVKIFIAMQKPAVDSFYVSKDSDWNTAFSILYQPLKPVSPQAAALQNEIDNTFDRYTNSIKKEHPFLYYVRSRITLLRKFLFENNEAFLTRGQIPGMKKLLSLFFHAYYYFILFLGIAGIVTLTWKGLRYNLLLLLLCIIPAYTILIHPFLRSADNRYLLPAWPFLIACSAYFILTVYSKFFPVKS